MTHVIEIADARLKLARLKARGEEIWLRKLFWRSDLGEEEAMVLHKCMVKNI